MLDPTPYSVDGYVEGASRPYVRNPARSQTEALALAGRMDETARARGWRVVVRVFYRDGTEVKRDRT